MRSAGMIYVAVSISESDRESIGKTNFRRKDSTQIETMQEYALVRHRDSMMECGEKLLRAGLSKSYTPARFVLAQQCQAPKFFIL